MKSLGFTLAESALSDKILRTLRMTWGKVVNVFSLSKGEGQGEGFITNKVKELINKPSPAFVVFANAQTQLLPLTKREGKRNLKELINLSTYPLIYINKIFPRPLRERVRERGKKAAFTLAEVLITLGIIGIVAAMTIPTLITNYQKHQTETQLLKFCSMMNQTLRMSVADNGDPDGWITAKKRYTYEETVEFLKTYIFPYMKHLGYKECSTNTQMWVCVTLMDGGVATFSIDRNGGDITYYNDERYVNNNTLPNIARHKFRFQMAKVSGIDNVTNSISYIEPYIYLWDKTEDKLINHASAGCKPNCTGCHYCTKMIQMNSWKIPSNYPW